MKRMLAIAAAILGTTSIASAADMAVKAPVYRAAPVLDLWSGFYVGANIGYSWGDWRADSNQPVYNFEQLTSRPKVDGVLGGVQAGFNWRVAPQWLFGFEADIQATGEKARQAWIDPGLPPTTIIPSCLCLPDVFVPRPGNAANLSHEWKFPWFGTVRLRAGFSPTPDWLLYVTGGLAYGRTEYSFNFFQPGAVLNQVGSTATTYALRQSSTDIGYAAGFGGEYKLSRNWSVKAEYLYIDLGKRSIVTTDIDGGPFRVSYSVRDHIARVGINYALDRGGPVVARY
ncbi:MAG TPA: outer membrane protein [Bradyrhizobium sp.]|nr:outer membrane protein [Bradyrhizobium sp.]